MRRRTARTAWVMFFLAGGEFEALFLGTVVLFGHPIGTFMRLQADALPAAYLVASAAAAVTFSIVRARNAADEARAHAWTEPVDLETLRQRIYSDSAPADDQRSKVRRMLDESHALAKAGTPVSSIAGSQRRR